VKIFEFLDNQLQSNTYDFRFENQNAVDFTDSITL